MTNRISTACALVALGLSVAPASAHAVKVDQKLTDTELMIVAYFDTDLPADDAAVTLRGPDGNVVATGKTDDTGTWKCPKPAPGTYQLHVKAFGSHEKTVPVEIPHPPAPVESGPPSKSRQVWLVAGVVGASVGVIVPALWVWRRRRRGAATDRLAAPDRPVPPDAGVGDEL